MNKKLEIVKEELNKNNIFDGSLNKVAETMTNMLSDEIPFSMSYAMANFTMASFVGHFHYKIRLADDNLVPPNIIIFILAKSGVGKTSSVEKLKLGFKSGYDAIHVKREARIRQQAEQHDMDMPRINPLDNALATEAGMIQRLNDFKSEGLGLPSMVVDEVSTELATNPDMVPNMKLVAQLFDAGDCKVKPLKDREAQSDEVKGMGMCALFIGSEHGVLEDDAVLKKFEEEFISKYARRCKLLFPTFVEKETNYETIDDILNDLNQKVNSVDEIKDALNNLSYTISSVPLQRDINLIEIDDEARKMYNIYTIYCEEMSKYETEEPAILEQKHRHWKALKLSGVYAIFNKRETITVQDLREAINAMELDSGDLKKFLRKARREIYEVMVDHYLEGGEDLTLHNMIKLGWIKKEANLKDLVKNANSMVGTVGRFELMGDKVIYAENDKVEDAGENMHISFKQLKPLRYDHIMAMGHDEATALKMAKENRAKYEIDDGYEYKKTTFDKIKNVLCNDMAYTPFRFKTKEEGGKWNEKNPNFEGREPVGGIRRKDNISSHAEFIVLDVDTSDYPITEAHDILCDYKHHIATTSNPNNIYKYRIILPIDIKVDIDGTRWQKLIQKSAEYLGFQVDDLAQSQIYYGFAGREVLSEYDGEVFPVSSIMKMIDWDTKKITPVPKGIRDAKWKDRLNEFAYAYAGRSKGGALHMGLFRAMIHARDLGFSYEENIELIDEIIEHIKIEHGDVPRDNFIPSLNSQRKKAYEDADGDFKYESD